MGMGGGVGMGMGMATSNTASNINVLRPTPAAPTSALPAHEMNYMARTLSTEAIPTAPKAPRQIFSEKGPDMSEFPALTSR
ncbi:hypothetical protein DYB25_001060 [Aphanomyces astaci]|uniref:Uncharacterized protein n=2 Tax=Aphanomyces astaci TaxID=112090 RepID=A0A396ZV09_APHAT|nr:hypothetical protein DYB36_004890 [Aphanomyces astaci]RHY03837.1 hypothetical protein DYB25_001060 [Aphanomyces astaci]RHY47654.1 hypothetical protein DYB38_005608 [Aphanomyces astaci]RHY52742.1 hypothetical protein DYB34_004337 [Aphanomyces astaci]RHY59163.1 hypothetical protein DYB30_004377 [Aphanomyces astaci]